ncbi:terminase small subunit [Bacillus sp. es.034]|uniref:terminase small subunit n=1 Tax=Bacillus sp. es.034 TaxID=1761763 RepID=UPI000BF6912B|nr:terminase small subunit [Bacillus sp. es.034]PFG07158.1 terminase small subunit [Bacillus sp. es.034]
MALTDKRTKSNIDGLTGKQRAFAIAYAGQGKGVIKESSKLVGIHVKTGEKYMKNPLVKKYINELATVNHEVMTGLEMQETLTNWIKGGQDEVYDFNTGKVVKVSVPKRDRTKMIELLAKMTNNLQPDIIHHVHTNTKPQEVIDLEKRWDAINQKDYYAPSEDKLKDIFGSDEE